MKRLCTCLLTLICILTAICVVPADATYDSGNFKGGGSWTFEEDGTIVISDVGILPDQNLPVYAPQRQVKHLVLKEGLHTIGEKNFYREYPDLKTVSLPTTLSKVKEFAFGALSSIESVYIYDLESWCSIQFENISSNPLSNAADLYLNGKKVNELAIPKSVECIENYTFAHCTSLSVVEIPATVKLVGKSAFNYCVNLTDVYFGGDAPIIGSHAFRGLTLNAYYPEDNPTWNLSNKRDYGGKITWIPVRCDGRHTKIVDLGVSPSCVKTGLTEGEHCCCCGTVTKKQEIIPKQSHNFEPWKTQYASTQEANGLERRKCIDCGLHEERSIPKLDLNEPVTEDENPVIWLIAVIGICFVVVIIGVLILLVLIRKRRKKSV